MSRIGFIGTGRITQAVVTGMMATTSPPARVLLSPRNAEVAAALAGQFEAVRIAADNQAVIDGSDTVFLAIRPQVTEEVLAPLRFRADQTVVSLVAIFPLAEVAKAVAPASEVCRCLPLPTAARREGPIVLYPAIAPAVRVLQGVGELVEARSEHELETLWVPTALIAPFFEHYAAVARWCEARGVPTDRADRYTRAMFHGLAGLAMAERLTSLAALRDEAQTPGGLNEQVLRELTAAGSFTAIEQAMDRIAERLAAAHRARA